MDSIPRELPALMRAEKLQSKAAKAGIDLTDAADYIAEKASALSADVNEKTIGELLFAVCAAARQNDIDPEEALTKVSDEFLSSFGEYEKSEDKNIYVAGAKLEGEKLLTSGGRVLGVTAVEESLEKAIDKILQDFYTDRCGAFGNHRSNISNGHCLYNHGLNKDSFRWQVPLSAHSF